MTASSGNSQSVTDMLNLMKSEIIGWINQAIVNAVVTGVTINYVTTYVPSPTEPILPVNVALLDTVQTFSQLKYFNAGITIRGGSLSLNVDNASYGQWVSVSNLDTGVGRIVGSSGTTDQMILEANFQGVATTAKVALQVTNSGASRHGSLVLKQNGDNFSINIGQDAGTFLGLRIGDVQGAGPAAPDPIATLDLFGTLALTARISPSQITSNQNNYNPTDLVTATVLRLNTDASRDITGLAGGIDDRIIIIVNVGGFNIVLKDESGSSTAANRFALTGDITISQDASAILMYDSTSSRWRLLSKT